MNKVRIFLMLFVLIVITLKDESIGAPSTGNQASQIYQLMNSFYKQLSSASLKATFKNDAQQPKSVDLAMKRPNCFSLITQDKTWGCAASDGKKLVCYSPMGNSYSVRQAPSQVSDIFKTLDFGGGVILCANWSIDDLLAGHNPGWLGNSPKGKYLGEEEIGKRKCHHLIFDESSVAAKTREFWIDAGNEPWLVRERYAKITVDYTDQKKNPKLDAAVFSYSTPANSKKVPQETVMNGLQSSSPAKR